MIKPYKILGFLTAILLLLLGIAWFVPQNVYKIGNFALRYPTFQSIQAKLIGDIALKKDTSLIHIATITIAKVDSLPVKTEKQNSNQPKIDTLITDDQSNKISAEIIKGKIIPIEFADSSRSALKNFFKSLSEGRSTTGQIHVLHFGDSQIEGDRVTMFIRSALQSKFGGNGVGVIPGYPQSYQPLNVKHSASGDWRYTSLFDGSDDVNQYGLLGGITEIEDGSEGEKIEFKKIGKDNRSNQFKQLRVFYGKNDSTYVMELGVNETTLDAEILPKKANITQQIFKIPITADDIELEFTGKGPLTVYGVSMESEHGIYVDNIPQRGNSGTAFTKFDSNFSQIIFNLLNVECVILQYGVNVVPGNLNNYKYYEEILYRQIKTIKSFKPNISVILIGVSDMSRKSGDKFESYPSIEKVRDAQRNAAFRAGAAFWDSYKAMGGRNSMPKWVNANPPLATKDFTHFNFRGSKLIAEMFVSALLNEYSNYTAQLTENANSNLSQVNKTTAISNGTN
ncbi:hypothetical protein CYCD_13740 [Tenuifilaceae bacterium CYCD]|nr:hypothetical protein CYCD_13740 [Tenuifilaceae bacterium CYCD]